MTGTFRKRQALLLLTLTAVLALVIVVMISPLMLDLFDASDDRWEHRSLIGQTYGAISAILAAVALGGVAATVMLQARDSRASRDFATRQAHRDLLRMAIDDPALLECFTIPGATPDDRRRHLYCNLFYSHWEKLHELGELTDAEAQILAIDSMQATPWQRYWAAIRTTWPDLDSTKRRRLWQLFENQYQAAVSSRSPRSEPDRAASE